MLPEPPHGGGCRHPALGFTGRDRPSEGCLEVVVLTLEAVEPATLVDGGEMRPALVRKGQEMLGVAALGRRRVLLSGQQLCGVLADGFQHAEPGFAVRQLGLAHQAVVDQ